ncbi:DNA (cytosine-5)-methyltransferase 3B, partial [Habropoda laboriosa]
RDGMNILAIFDGISVGRVALERASIKVDNYYRAEIDKHANIVASSHYPDDINFGDVIKWREWDLDWASIDLLIGGSPCQSFSIAAAITGNRNGLDGKSGLFYIYLDILNHIKSLNPNIRFMLENVKMKNESKKQLDEYLGVKGKYFNSELVSFQKRPRYYWTNWDWDLPVDKKISFQDYKQDGDLSKYKVKETPSRIKMWSNGKGRKNGFGACANVTYSDKIYCLTTKQDRCPNSGLIEYDGFCRYLTQNELEIAQTLPTGYTSCVSYNQAQKVLGNGWTADAIAHIFRGIECG